MTIPTNLCDQLIRDESIEHEAYPDPRSALGKLCAARKIPMREYRHIVAWQSFSGDPWTIGVGHTGPEVHQGLIWLDAQVMRALDGDIADVDSHLAVRFPWTNNLDRVRRAVLLNMAFNLGIDGLSKFHDTLAAVQIGNYDQAAAEMKDSLWYGQVGARAERLVTQMKTGNWV